MENSKRRNMMLAAAIVISFAATGLSVSAAETSKANRMGELVAAIAQRFNLNSADVQKVVDEQHAKRQAMHTQKFTERVNEAVAAGKLTQDQANKIFAKKAEIEAFRATLKNITEEQRREAIKAQMASLRQWAIDNNIPAGFLMFLNHKKPHGHHGLKLPKADRLAPSATQSN